MGKGVLVRCGVLVAGCPAWLQDPGAAMVILEKALSSLQPGEHHSRSYILHLHDRERKVTAGSVEETKLTWLTLHCPFILSVFLQEGREPPLQLFLASHLWFCYLTWLWLLCSALLPKTRVVLKWRCPFRHLGGSCARSVLFLCVGLYACCHSTTVQILVLESWNHYLCSPMNYMANVLHLGPPRRCELGNGATVPVYGQEWNPLG